jgi:oligopeptide transport system substrate-binding protein
MMKTSKIKLCVITLATIFSMSILNVYCFKSVANAETISKQEITCNLEGDPRTLDPTLCADSTGFNVLANSFVGLCELDKSGKAIKGDAESWEISSDGLTYIFHLRKDLKWSNGDALKASDYEYAWKRVLNPEIDSVYSFELLYLKGAEAYNTGKGSADDVGVKAIDDNTLIVKLEAPTPYFLELASQAYYYPVNQKIVESNKYWATTAKDLVSNGPFKITDYKIRDKIILEKNENYYDKDSVKLDKLIMTFVPEETTVWAGYKSGQFDVIDAVAKSEVQGALKDKSATSASNLGINFLSINISDKAKALDPNAAKVLSDSKVRRALSISIDRQSIIDNVTKFGQVPAHGIVAKGIIAPDGKDFTDKTSYFAASANIEEAKKLLAEAGYPEGKGLPTITLMYNPESGNADIMQAIQGMWKKIGVNTELVSKEWKVFVKTRDEKNYLIARDGWIGDYADPMSFLDMFVSTAVPNDCGYASPEYDKLIDAAKKELDANKRFDLLHQAEDKLMADMPVIPLYYYNNVVGIRDYVKDARISVMKVIYFKNAYVEGKK